MLGMLGSLFLSSFEPCFPGVLFYFEDTENKVIAFDKDPVRN